jgi:alpha 1,3-glucosidase
VISPSLSPNGGAYGDPYRLYNLDVFEYELDNPMALYGAIPFVSTRGAYGLLGWISLTFLRFLFQMMSHDVGRTTAILWLNTAETFIDVGEGKEGVRTLVLCIHFFSPFCQLVF